MQIVAPVKIDFNTGELSGRQLVESVRTVGDLEGVFNDEQARQRHEQNVPVYRIQCYFPVNEGAEGGLFWGNTTIEPGQIADEYFMTKGHFHRIRNRGEYYVTIMGEGALILMNEERHTWMEPMMPGTMHYIPGSTAHRVANIGATRFSFLACWPSDAGHDYETIARRNFSARLRKINNVPTLVDEHQAG